MTFGFGVSDILAVGALVRNVYNSYSTGPEQFRNLSQEILSLHVVIRKVEDQLGIAGPDETGSAETSRRQLRSHTVASLSTRDKDDLKILYEGLQNIMKELDDLLKKYHSLASNCSPIDRLRWGLEDLVGFRDKLRSNITLLTSFNATLARYVPLPPLFKFF